MGTSWVKQQGMLHCLRQCAPVVRARYPSGGFVPWDLWVPGPVSDDNGDINGAVERTLTAVGAALAATLGHTD